MISLKIETIESSINCLIQCLIFWRCKNKNLCEAVLNNGEKRRKVSTLENQVGKDIFWAILLLFVLCTTSSARAVIFENSVETFWYIPPIPLAVGNDFTIGFFSFMQMVIILQVLIPISLYVSVEMVKLMQVLMITQGNKRPRTTTRVEVLRPPYKRFSIFFKYSFYKINFYSWQSKLSYYIK